MHLQVPSDEVRDSRFTFLETNRLPKQLRRRISQEQLDKMPYRDWSLSQSYQTCQDAYPVTQTWRTEHLRQVYHRKNKLWSGSIARRHHKRELGRVATAVDITKSLGIPSMKSDNYYLVSNAVNNEQTQADDRLVEDDREHHSDIYRRSVSDMRITTGAECPTLRVESRNCGTRATHYRPTHQCRNWRSGMQVASAATLNSRENVTLSKLPSGICRLVQTPGESKESQVKGKLVTGKASKSDDLPNSIGLQEELISRRIPIDEPQEHRKTDLTSRRVGTSKLPSMSDQPRQLTRRPATTHVKDGKTWSDEDKMELIEDKSSARKPVIPSQAQLTEVMHSCKAFQGVDPITTDRHQYLSQEYSFHVINKYHGDQIVVDSTEYDNFARKLIKK